MALVKVDSGQQPPFRLCLVQDNRSTFLFFICLRLERKARLVPVQILPLLEFGLGGMWI